MLRYFLPFLPGCPQIGHYYECDCAITQSYGRKGILDKDLGKEIELARLHSEYDDRKTFDRLRRDGFSGGRSNAQLGQYIFKTFQMSSRTVILQWEVAYEIYIAEPHWYEFALSENRLAVLWPPKSGYFSTYQVKKASVDEMKKRGLRRPLEVAHSSMVVRAVLILWRLGINPVVLPEGDSLNAWDADSVQPWTRNRFLWLLRETPGRVHHLLFRFVKLTPPK
jgi:hypothetical protein